MLDHIDGSCIMNRPFGLPSQGEGQRVLSARALVHRPSLLILDEPYAGLDLRVREEFLAGLGQWAASPEAPVIVLASHHIEEIGPWVERILVPRNGGVLAAGPKPVVLTSRILSEAFGCHGEVEDLKDRYWFRVSDVRNPASA